MANVRDEVSWQTVAPEALPVTVRKAHDAFKKAKATFEDAVTKALTKKKSIPEGTVPLYSYRAGRFAVGFAPIERVTAKGTIEKPKGAQLFG